MKTAKIISLLLALLMLTAAAAACAGNGGSDNAVTTAEASADPSGTQDPAQTEDPDFVCDLPENLNYNQAQIHLIVDNYKYSSDEFFAEEADGGLVNGAVFSRNALIEDRLGVQLDIMRVDTTSDTAVAKAVEACVNVNDKTYDIATIPGYRATQYLNGNFRNLLDVENLNLEKHYWTQGFNDVMRPGNTQYLASGAYSLSMIRGMYVTLYNKELLAERHLEDPYVMVNDNRWTFENQTAMLKDCYDDLNGSTTRDADDFYGFAGGCYTTSDPYWVSMNMQFLRNDKTAGEYALSVDYEKFVNIISLYHDFMYNNSGAYCVSNAVKDANGVYTYEAITNMFINRRAAMVTIEISLIEQQVAPSGFSDDYGIVPLPKYNTDQQDFCTHTSDRLTTMAVVSTVPDDRLPMIGAVMEMIAAESYKTVFPTYYDTALSYRYLQNPESKVMLDKIYSSIRIEGAFLYSSYFGMLGDFRKLFANGNATVSSVKGLAKTWDAAVRKLNENMK